MAGQRQLQLGLMLAALLGLALAWRGWGWLGSRWCSGSISDHSALPLGVVAAAATTPFAALAAESGARPLCH